MLCGKSWANLDTGRKSGEWHNASAPFCLFRRHMHQPQAGIRCVFDLLGSSSVLDHNQGAGLKRAGIVFFGCQVTQEVPLTPRPLAILREEHRQMARLLDLLERQIDLTDKGLEPDSELLIEIADYFRSFPDLYHHPKEELIIDYLEARKAPRADELAHLRDEHEECSRELSRFCRAVVDLLIEPQKGRAAFARVAHAFLSGERRHMAWEEERFFEIAEVGLGPDDWAEIEAKIGRLRYPAFEREALSRFNTLGRELARGWSRPAV
jgi:hemerythrin-like domain-containing protein